MTHLTSTVIRSSQADGRDSCKEEAGTFPKGHHQPGTRLPPGPEGPAHGPGMAEGAGVRRPPGSEVETRQRRSAQENILRQSPCSPDVYGSLQSGWTPTNSTGSGTLRPDCRQRPSLARGMKLAGSLERSQSWAVDGTGHRPSHVSPKQHTAAARQMQGPLRGMTWMEGGGPGINPVPGMGV